MAEIDDAAGGWDEGVGYLHAPLTTGHDPGGEAPSAAALLPQRDPLHLLPTQPQDLLERVRRVGSLPPAVRQQLERALGEPSEALRAGGEALERLMGVGEALLGEPVEQLDPLQAALKGVFSQPESRPQADGAPQKSPLDAVIGAVLTPHSAVNGGDSAPKDVPSSVVSNNPELVGGAADRAARGVNALAFTVGRDLYFRADAWAPGTEEGDRVLLHELTHVAQEDDGRVTTPQAGADLSRPTDPLEREASQAEAGPSAGAGKSGWSRLG